MITLDRMLHPSISAARVAGTDLPEITDKHGSPHARVQWEGIFGGIDEIEGEELARKGARQVRGKKKPRRGLFRV